MEYDINGFGDDRLIVRRLGIDCFWCVIMNIQSILEPKRCTDFGGSSSISGTTGPFWIASGLAVLSATVVFLLVKPLSHDGMAAEDEAVCTSVSPPSQMVCYDICSTVPLVLGGERVRHFSDGHARLGGFVRLL